MVDAPKPGPAKKDDVEDDVPYIVYKQTYFTDDGTQHVKEHRVKQSEWPAYEKEHGF